MNGSDVPIQNLYSNYGDYNTTYSIQVGSPGSL